MFCSSFWTLYDRLIQCKDVQVELSENEKIQKDLDSGKSTAKSNLNELALSSLPAVPGFFRLLTLLAIMIFLQEEVDIIILEVGMGGRYDATNVWPPNSVIATAITSLSLEHTNILGSTIEEIAYEKGGIMKTGVPCFFPSADSYIPSSTISILNRCCTEVNGNDTNGLLYSLKSLPKTYRHTEEYGCNSRAIDESINLGIPGEYQYSNASLALLLARTFQIHRQLCIKSDNDKLSVSENIANLDKESKSNLDSLIKNVFRKKEGRLNNPSSVESHMHNHEKHDTIQNNQLNEIIEIDPLVYLSEARRGDIDSLLETEYNTDILSALQSVKWPGRCQEMHIDAFDIQRKLLSDVGYVKEGPTDTMNHVEESISFPPFRLYLDGGHTIDSVSSATKWFSSKMQAYQEDHPNIRKSFIFNCNAEKEPLLLLQSLLCHFFVLDDSKKCSHPLAVLDPDLQHELDRRDLSKIESEQITQFLWQFYHQANFVAPSAGRPTLALFKTAKEMIVNGISFAESEKNSMESIEAENLRGRSTLTFCESEILQGHLNKIEEFDAKIEKSYTALNLMPNNWQASLRHVYCALLLFYLEDTVASFLNSSKLVDSKTLSSTQMPFASGTLHPKIRNLIFDWFVKVQLPCINVEESLIESLHDSVTKSYSGGDESISSADAQSLSGIPYQSGVENAVLVIGSLYLVGDMLKVVEQYDFPIIKR